MHIGTGQVLELILEDGIGYVRLACPERLTPMPGQYLLASDGSQSPLPVPFFHSDFAPHGFVAAAETSVAWSPGQTLDLRGPLGRGFSLPPGARKVGLVAFGGSSARLRGLIRQALKQDAAVVLVDNRAPDSLPDEVEVQPLSALREILEWTDYLAFDVGREDLDPLKEQLAKGIHLAASGAVQVLIRTPVPCGGIAECGVCAVTLPAEWRLACKDGPVFDWRELA